MESGAVSQTGEQTGVTGATGATETGTGAGETKPTTEQANKVESTAVAKTSTGTQQTDTLDRNSPYRPEDWLERHPTGLPQRILDRLSQIKINFTLPAVVDWTNLRTWAPIRHRVCKATAEEQAKYRETLDLIFSGHHILGKRVKFSQQLIMDVLDKVVDIIALEPMLIEDIPGDINVVGDLHGQIHDLWRILDSVTGLKFPGKKIYEHGNYLFLGDYVDRGNNSLEVVMALFLLKILYPDRFFLLRGNHEFHHTNIGYGFYYELEERYGEVVGFNIYLAINEAFGWLSAAGIIGDKIFCAHAGISCEGFSRSEMAAMRKPMYVSTDDTTLHDLVWSDPMDGLEGIMYNFNRGTSIYFGEDVLDFALRKIGCFMMIRGHTIIDDGYQYIWDGRCLTTFSATGTPGSNNDGAYIYVSSDLFITPYHMKLNPKYREFIKVCALQSRRFVRDMNAKYDKEDMEKKMKKRPEKEEEEDKDEITAYDRDGCEGPSTGKIAVFEGAKNKAK